MIIIENLLKNVDKEKKLSILNSAMKEFSANTFDKASTNKIVKDAGISKGLLFHYFGTKKRLFEYLQYFSIKVITDEIIDKLNWEQRDIFSRIKEISMIKFQVHKQYPYLSEFSLLVFQDKTVEEIMKIAPGFPLELYSQIYSYNIDYSFFKEDIDVKRAIDIIRWTIEKYGEEYRRNAQNKNIEFDYKAVEKETYKYTDMLKESFYK